MNKKWKRLLFVSMLVVFFVGGLPEFLCSAKAGQEGNVQIKLAAIVLNTETFHDVQEVKKMIKDLGGEVISFLPPSVLRVKITEEMANALLQNPFIEDVSFGVLDEKRYQKHDIKIRENIRFNNLVQTERKKIKEFNFNKKNGKKNQDEEPFQDDLFFPSESELSSEEMDKIKSRYNENWKKNGKRIREKIFERMGLKYREEDGEDVGNDETKQGLNQDGLILYAPELGDDGSGLDLGNDPVFSNYSINDLYSTSLYMAGEIAVGIFFIPGDYGEWPASEIDAAYASTVAALELFCDDEPNANISWTFVKEVENGVPNSFPAGDPRIYVNDLRNSIGSDWAFVIGAVYGNGRASATYYGPNFWIYSVGLQNGYLARHETCHMFGAMDQYYPDAQRGPTDSWGYLEVINANAQFNDGTGYFFGRGESQPDIMVSSPGNRILGVYTRGQLGWYDSDGDGIIDPLDTFPKTTIAESTMEENNIIIKGFSKDMPLRHEINRYNTSIYKNITINKISKVEYRINGLSWIDAAADDSAWDEDVENFTIQTLPLPNGLYEIEVRAKNSVGNIEKIPAKIKLSVDLLNNPVIDSAPFPSFSLSDQNISLSSLVHFDASASRDLEDGPEQLYARWDIDGDGMFDSGWQPINELYTASYLMSGEKTITMELKDSSGNVSSLSREIMVVDYNLAPKISFIVNPPNKQGNDGLELEVMVKADEAFDLEDPVSDLSIRWEFYKDKGFSSWAAFPLAAELNHSYLWRPATAASWSERITAEIRDGAGAVSRATRNFWVVNYNHPPVLNDFIYTRHDDRIHFQVSDFFDPDAGTTWDPWRKVRWDFESDGIWDTKFVDPEEPGEFLFQGEDSIAVTCQIRDSFFATAQLTKDIDLGEVTTPAFDPIGNKSVFIGSLLSFSVVSLDPEGDQISLSFEFIGNSGSSSYNILNPPEFIDHGDGTGTFSWDTSGGSIDNVQSVWADFRFTATDSFGNSVSEIIRITLDPVPGEIISPAEGDLIEAWVTFTWSPGGKNAESYQLNIGTTSGASDITSLETTATTLTIKTIPLSGQNIYVQLKTKMVNGEWVSTPVKSYYRPYVEPGPAKLLSPAPGSAFESSEVTFSWSRGTAGVVTLEVGSTIFGKQYFVGKVDGTSITLSNLPTDRAVFVTFHSYWEGGESLERYMFNNIAPRFTGMVDEITITAGELLQIDLTAEDDDGDDLIFLFDVGNAPDGVQFRDNGDGSAVFEWRPDRNQEGTYEFRFTVSDGASVDFQTIKIFVLDNQDFLSVESCQELTEKDQTYILTKDLTGPEVTDKCFLIKASGITLDCNGHKIENTSLQGSFIYVNAWRSTVKNCTLVGPTTGTYNSSTGIASYWSDHSVIENNTIRGFGSGIWVHANKNIIQNNLVENSIKGINVRLDGNIVKNNTSRNNRRGQGWGFSSWVGTNTLFENNVSTGNRYGNILAYANGSIIRGGQYAGNQSYDLYIYNGSKNIILDKVSYMKKYISGDSSVTENP